jgi:hypothetical protein
MSTPTEPPAEPVKPTVLPAGTPLPSRPTASTVQPTDGSPTPRPRRTRKGWDIGLSIGLLVISLVGYSVAAVLAFLFVIFFTGCNEHGCGVGDAPYIAAGVLGCIVVIGVIATIVALVLKFRGFPLATITLATVIIGWIVIFALGAV